MGFTSCDEGFGGGAEHVFEDNLNHEPYIQNDEMPGDRVRVARTTPILGLDLKVRWGSGENKRREFPEYLSFGLVASYKLVECHWSEDDEF